MRLALFQSEPQGMRGIEAALDLLDRAANEAMADGADLLVTPEMYLTGYAIGTDRVRKVAMNDDDSAMTAVSRIAGRHGIGIVVGYPQANGTALPYNTARFFGRGGEDLATYRKTHLWPAVDDAQFSRGDSLSPVVAFAGAKIAMGICYDIEFPEYARALRLAGADVVAVPTASQAGYASMATRIVPTRAEENAMTVAYCNYCGAEGETPYFGTSVICGPDGETLARAGDDEAVIAADLSRRMKDGDDVLDRIPSRRPDLYDTLIVSVP